MTEEEKRKFYEELKERTEQLRINYLFEEHCPLYEDDEDGME